MPLCPVKVDHEGQGLRYSTADKAPPQVSEILSIILDRVDADLGSPAQVVARLATKLAEYGIRLNAGEIILSASAMEAMPVKSDDSIHLVVDWIGEVK